MTTISGRRCLICRSASSPANSRHAEVEQDHIHAGVFEDFVRLIGVLRRVGGETKSLGYVAAALSHETLVVDDQQIQ